MTFSKEQRPTIVAFMAALAAIADHEDGYLVRLLLQQNEHEHNDDL